MRTVEFDFELPESLIAQHPPAQRGGSRLLHVAGSLLAHRQFADLPDLLCAGDLLVLNDTRVIKARLFGHKASGGRIEVLIERVLDGQQALAQIRASKSPKAGAHLLLAGALTATVLGRADEFYQLQFHCDEDLYAVFDRIGQLPLPPYITHGAGAEDESRYQTVFARQPGAVAAPTAGLHFDQAMLATLRGRGVNTATVTLHVGAGTFQPVRTEQVADHPMHSERYSVPAETVAAIQETRARGGRVVAVGTTSLRALESAAQSGELQAGGGETRIFITPGYRFRVVDRLLTNFHLPKSTLLMLVCAFGGMDNLLAAYRSAVTQQYRFFSYGDAMLIEREPDRARLTD